MPRDMTGTGRYPPQPRYPPFSFYSAVRLADPEMLAKVLAADPYFVTQAGAAAICRAGLLLQRVLRALTSRSPAARRTTGRARRCTSP
jgi:hypothetical protein